MAKCGECCQSEACCTCKRAGVLGPNAQGVITLPNGDRYLHREWAAAWALFTLGILGGLGLMWAALTH